MRTSLDEMSGKQLLLLLVVGLLLMAGLLFYLLGSAAWRLWNIPTMSPSFADIRSILLGIQAGRLGYDPLYQNPLDPFGRAMAYPRLWLLLGVLPLTSANTPFVAAVEMALFLLGIFLFTDRLDRQDAVLIAALLISPAIMLCFERGNTDLVSFFLLACALALISRSRALSVLLVELAAFLKLYPAVALGYLLRESKRTLALWLSIGLMVFGLYAALTWRDIHQILSVAPKGVGFNYGVSVVGLWVLDLTASPGLADIVVLLSYLLAYALLIYALYRSHRDQLVLSAENSRALNAFRVGALIYIGTFLQGNTWNYRLIFLIFVLPQLYEWARTAVPPARRAAAASIALLMLSAWLPIFGASEPPSSSLLGSVQLVVDELSNWGLWAGLTYLLFASLPEWTREQIALFFRKYSRPFRLPA